MKILLINTYDKWGAANSCLRLHKGLLTIGINSHVLLRYKDKNIPFTEVFKSRKVKKSKLQKLKFKFRTILKEFKLIKVPSPSEKELFLRNRSKKLESFSFPDSKLDITTSKLYQDADVINLHWVANFLDYPSFFHKNEKPVVWTLHDMNPFSGGEHYLENYLGIDEFGFPIKRNLSEEEINIAERNIDTKKQALAKVNNLTIVAPSEWLANEARKSEVFKGYPVYCIPYGLDSEIYKPRDKDYSRALLNIPKEKKVILFVADSIDNNRKGFIFLKRAFKQLSNPDLILCAIGKKSNEYETLGNIIELGTIYDERLMSAAYSAADVFIIPSIMDNLPNTVLESLMCGTPVIGFPVGGITEMIENEVNGLLTEDISVNSLVKTITKFLNTSDNFNSVKIRSAALNKYDKKVQSQKYIDLFTSILNKNS